MKPIEWIVIGLIGIAVIWAIIKKGQRDLDPIVDFFVHGDDLEAPQGSENYPSWLVRLNAWKSGNPHAGTLGTHRSSVWDWDPFNLYGHGSRWGALGG